MIYFLLAIITAAIIYLYFYVTRNFNHWKNKGVPYIEPNPLFGNVLSIATGEIAVGNFFNNIYQSCNWPYMGIYVLDQYFLLIKDPKIILNALIKDSHSFTNKFVLHEKHDPLICNTPPAAKRTHLKSNFISNKLKLMFPLVIECGYPLKRYFDEHLNQIVEMKEICTKFTIDVIVSCVFGVNGCCFNRENSRFQVFARRIFDFNSNPIMSYSHLNFIHNLLELFNLDFVNKETVDFMKQMFWENIEARKTNNTKRNDLIDVLLNMKSEENVTDFEIYKDSIIEKAVMYFSVSHESSSTAMSFTLYELCLNSSIQDRARKEIMETIAKHGRLTYDGINEMKYLKMVLSETLRKYPITPILYRETKEDYVIQETGLKLEKGTPILISQYGLHFDPKYFPNPGKFDPERFNDKNKPKIPPGAYLPFGNGPRSYKGEKFGLLLVKVGLAMLLKDYEVVRCEETPIPAVIIQRAHIITSVDGLLMKLRKLK